MASSATHRRQSGVSRRLTRSAPPMLLPSLPNPMVQISFEGGRHMIPDRLPSARKERLVGLKVIELGQETKQNILSAASTLKRLDLSNLCLTEMPQEFFEELSNLERLNVSKNQLTEDSFTSSLKNLERLIEIDACDNKLSQIPKSIYRLKKVSRLKLAKNNLKSADGVEKLKRLTQLDLDDNAIENLPQEFYVRLRKLEVLQMTRNSLREISNNIRSMRHLKEIDVSNNKLNGLPVELLTLPHLQYLNASHNTIVRLPTDVLKGKAGHRISSLDLSGNILTKFPEQYLQLTDSLDLSGNKIKSISGKQLKKVKWREDQQLILDDNPLVSPPLEVCECGIRAIMQYFQETKSEMKVHQGVRVLVVGPYRSGKTSMAQTLVDLQARLMNDSDRTRGVDVYDTSFDLENGDEEPKCLQMTIWDFSGNRQYAAWSQNFLIQPSVILFTFSLTDYRKELFQTIIGQWLDWILAKNNKVVLIIIGTHADKMRKDGIKEICDEVKSRIERHIETHRKNIDQQFKAVEMKYMKLRVQTKIYPNIIPFSSANGTGLDELQNAIIEVTKDEKFFPNILRSIPSIWADVEVYLDDFGYNMAVPLLSWDHLVSEVSRKFGMKHLVSQIAEYLHDTGKIIWFSEHPSLQNWVILRPSWLMELLHSLISHDALEIDLGHHEEIVKLLGLTSQRLERMKELYRDEGIIEKDLLRILWSKSFASNPSTQILLNSIRFLVEHFDIGYVVDRPQQDGRLTVLSFNEEAQVKEEPENLEAWGRLESTSTAREHSLVPGKFQCLLVPLLRDYKQPKAFRADYERFVHQSALVANIRFPTYFPLGLFNTICVRAATRYNLDTLYHWDRGLYARQTQDVRCRFYLLCIKHEDGSTCVRTELRNEEGSTEQHIENLWTVLLPFLTMFDTVIASFVGIRVKRNMECPGCHALSFPGEWQVPPGELQNSDSMKCSVCKEDISTAYIIQPKEKKKVEEFLRLRRQGNSSRASSSLALTMTEKDTAETLADDTETFTGEEAFSHHDH